MTTVLEADIETKFVRYVESLGYEALKLRIDGENSYPDRSVMTDGGRTLIVEFKRPGCKPDRGQERRLAKLQRLGYVAFWTDSLEFACNALDRFLAGEINCYGDLVE